MTTKNRASQIGFFGLNGARVILGLTILICIDGFFGFLVVDSLLKSDLSNSIQALIFAFIIACASLLGIIISEILDRVIIIYWRGVSNKRLVKFEDDIKDRNNNEFPDVSLYDLYYDGEIWNDRYLLSYKQEIMTRWILILALLIAGYLIFLREIQQIGKPIEIVTTARFSKFVSEYALAILYFIIISLFLLLFSLKLVSERKWKDSLTECLREFFLIPSVILYPIILGTTQACFPHSNTGVTRLISILSISTISVMLFSLCILTFWISSKEKHGQQTKKTIREWTVLIFILIFLLLITLSISATIVGLYVDPRNILIPILILFMFLISSLFQIYLQIIQRTARKGRSDQKIFGVQTKDKSVQWCDLIVMYYGLFFNSVKDETQSKLETYQQMISGIYTYQSIYRYFTTATKESEKNIEGQENNISYKQGINEIDKENLEYIEYLSGFINSVELELNRENLEIAVRFYNSFKEAMLAYFLSSAFINVKKSWLADITAASYVINNDLVYDMIGGISNTGSLIFIYNNLKGYLPRKRAEGNARFLSTFLQNPGCNYELREKIVEENIEEIGYLFRWTRYLVTLSVNTTFCLTVARNKNTPSGTLVKLSEDHNDTDIIIAVAENPNTPPGTLVKLSEGHNDTDIIIAVAENPNTPPGTLVKLSEGHNDTDIIIAVAKNPSTLEETLVKLSEDQNDTDIIRAVAENPSTPEYILIILSENYHDNIEIIRAVAGNPNTSEDTLVEFSEMLGDKDNNYTWLYITVAGNPNTPPDTLVKLNEEHNDDINISFIVAGNPNTPPDTLAELNNKFSPLLNTYFDRSIHPEDYEYYARSIPFQVAENPNTPPDTLIKLSEDRNHTGLRIAVAENPNTPPDTLVKLSEDHNNADLRIAVAENPNTPPDTLDKLSEDHNNADLRIAVAENPNTPPDTLDKLSEDRNYYVHRAVAENPNTPPDTLDKLSEDRNYYVHRAAKNSLQFL